MIEKCGDVYVRLKPIFLLGTTMLSEDEFFNVQLKETAATVISL